MGPMYVFEYYEMCCLWAHFILLLKSFQVNQGNSRGERPLNRAIIEAFHHGGIDLMLFWALSFGFNQMCWISVVETGYKKLIDLMIEKGADVNAVENKLKLTPLHIVASHQSMRGYYDHEWNDDDSLSNFPFHFFCFWVSHFDLCWFLIK